MVLVHTATKDKDKCSMSLLSDPQVSFGLQRRRDISGECMHVLGSWCTAMLGLVCSSVRWYAAEVLGSRFCPAWDALSR